MSLFSSFSITLSLSLLHYICLSSLPSLIVILPNILFFHKYMHTHMYTHAYSLAHIRVYLQPHAHQHTRPNTQSQYTPPIYIYELGPVYVCSTYLGTVLGFILILGEVVKHSIVDLCILVVFSKLLEVFSRF